MPDNKVMIEVGVNAPDVVKKIQEITGANQKLQEQLDAIKLKNGETSQAYIRLNAELEIGKAKLGEYNSQLQAIYTTSDNSVQKLAGLEAQYEALKIALDNLSEAERNSPKGQELAGALGQVDGQIKAVTASTTEMKDMFTGAMTNIGNSANTVLTAFGNTEMAQNTQIAITGALNTTTLAYTTARGFANAADLAAALQAKTATAAAQGWGIAIKANAAFTKVNNTATATASTVMRGFGLTVNTSSNAFRVLKGAIISTGLGLLVVALGEVVNYLTTMGDEATEAGDDLDALTEAKQKFINTAIENIAKEKTELTTLTAIAKDETKSKEDRVEAIKKLNELSPEFLGKLNLENINTENATKAMNAYNESLIRRAKAVAAMDMLVDIEKKFLEYQFKGVSKDWLDGMRTNMTPVIKQLTDIYNDGYKQIDKGAKASAKGIGDYGKGVAASMKTTAEDTATEVTKLVDKISNAAGYDKIANFQKMKKDTEDLKNDIDTILNSVTNSTIKLSKEQGKLKDYLEKAAIEKGFKNWEDFAESIVKSIPGMLNKALENVDFFSSDPDIYKRELELFNKLTKEHAADGNKIWRDYLTTRANDQSVSLEQFLKNELDMQESIKRSAKQATDLIQNQQKENGELSPYTKEDADFKEIETKENAILGVGLANKKALWANYWASVKAGNEQSYNDWLEELNKQALAEKKSLEDRAQMQADFLNAVGDLFKASLTETGFDLEKFAQGFVNLILDMIERVVLAAVVQANAQSLASPDSIATGGITGIAKAALLTGLIKAAFTAVKATLGKKIKSSFADGGIVNGPPHAQGGVKYYSPGGVVELEGGEAVINKNATARFLPLLSAINAAGGGVKFAQGGIIPAYSNAMVSQNIVNQNMGFDYTMLAKAIAQMPAPVVAVEDISSAQGRITRIANRARI